METLAAGYIEALATAWAWCTSLYLSVVLWKWFVPAMVGAFFAALIVVTLCQISYFRLRGWKLWRQPGGHVVLEKGNGEWRYFSVNRHFGPALDNGIDDSDWISGDSTKSLGMRNLGV